jgi:type IV pilus assembly protein PilA
MSSAPHLPSPAAPRGFTLVEIMVVVVIIGLLAALAIPAFQRSQRASQNARAINDFRIFSQAFEIYNAQHGAWPNNVGAGVIPSLPYPMAGDFKADAWQATSTSIGGRWNWDNNITSNGTAGISISNTASSSLVSDAQLTEIDEKLDDGNLSSGIFQKVSASRVTYFLVQP